VIRCISKNDFEVNDKTEFVKCPAIELSLCYPGILLMHTVLTPKARIKDKLNITYGLTEWGFPLVLSVRNILLALGNCKKVYRISKTKKYSMHFQNKHP
jgi:hypothetical protein